MSVIRRLVLLAISLSISPVAPAQTQVVVLSHHIDNLYKEKAIQFWTGAKFEKEHIKLKFSTGGREQVAQAKLKSNKSENLLTSKRSPNAEILGRYRHRDKKIDFYDTLGFGSTTSKGSELRAKRFDKESIYHALKQGKKSLCIYFSLDQEHNKRIFHEVYTYFKPEKRAELKDSLILAVEKTYSTTTDEEKLKEQLNLNLSSICSQLEEDNILDHNALRATFFEQQADQTWTVNEDKILWVDVYDEASDKHLQAFQALKSIDAAWLIEKTNAPDHGGSPCMATLQQPAVWIPLVLILLGGLATGGFFLYKKLVKKPETSKVTSR